MITGAIPDYVPMHLRGKVFDFRNEQNGKISFSHPEAALGLGPEASRVSLTPAEYRTTFDRDTRSADMPTAIAKQYAPLERHQSTTGQKINDGIANALRKSYDWGTSSQGKAVGTAALLSALAGAAGSYAIGRQTGEQSIGRTLLMALLAGGLGAGATTISQRNYNKRLMSGGDPAFAKMANTQTSDIIRMLNGDPTLSSYDRSQILMGIASLRPSDQDNLYRLAKTGAGAGIGMLIMRFLSSKGLLPMLAGGIIGGLLADRPAPLVRNPLGQVSITNYL